MTPLAAKRLLVVREPIGKQPLTCLLCNLTEHFPDDFMGSITSFRSYRMKHEAHFVIYGLHKEYKRRINVNDSSVKDQCVRSVRGFTLQHVKKIFFYFLTTHTDIPCVN